MEPVERTAWRGVAGFAVLLSLALALAACASPIVPLAPGVVTLQPDPLQPAAPDGFVPPAVKDPTGTLVGWLDLRYGTSDDVEPAAQSLDLIAPATVVGDEAIAPQRGLPVVLFVHGGGWSRGEKRGFLERRAPAFGRAGCILATMNYRLAPAETHPTQVRDVAAALAWLKVNARAFGGDPGALFVMGHSAGAHLAALAAVDERWLGEQQLGLDALRGAILIDGAAYDVLARSDDRAGAVAILEQAFGSDRDDWEDASPLRHVAPGKKIAPCLLLRAGRNPDSEEPTRLLAEALVAAGVITQVTHFPNKSHVTISRDLGLPGDGPTWRILDFVAEQTGRPRPPKPPPPAKLQEGEPPAEPTEGDKDGNKDGDGAAPPEPRAEGGGGVALAGARGDR